LFTNLVGMASRSIEMAFQFILDALWCLIMTERAQSMEVAPT
jgi:hypothetical protein